MTVPCRECNLPSFNICSQPRSLPVDYNTAKLIKRSSCRSLSFDKEKVTSELLMETMVGLKSKFCWKRVHGKFDNNNNS